jgi:anion-transporting  ArsA/GET3 family ATPase
MLFHFFIPCTILELFFLTYLDHRDFMNSILQQDEQQRAFLANNVKTMEDLASFLTSFEKQARSSLNEMNTRLDRMEQVTSYLEFKVNK